MPARDGDLYTLILPTKPKRTFRVEVVASPEALRQGLSGRKSLASGHGMFFIFPTLDRHSMWMPDMSFPLDIVWLDENLVVANINLAAIPCQSKLNCPSYLSEKMVKYAIEMPAGDAVKYGFQVGLQISI